MTRLSLIAPRLLAAWLCLLPAGLAGQEPDANYEESKVPEYTLPDPLVASDGTRVTDAAAWTGRRRPELLRLFTEQVYGRSPGKPDELSCVVTDTASVMNGLAIRKQVTLTFRHQGKEQAVEVLLYLPQGRSGPAPAFLGLNFRGNHTLSTDPAIKLNPNWMRQGERTGVVDNRATDAARGTDARSWPVELILRRGYALVTAYYGDIDPDFDDGFKNGVHALLEQPGRTERPADAWGSIGAWAWGLSRIMDYLETDGQVDPRRVVVLGHSRLGKTALWAGAQDQRFAGVISNNSGCGGAALSRRAFGETVAIINQGFPHWFCGNFKQYNEREGALPVDQHELLALVAPRPLYVASASEDLWADPRGEYLALRHAEPVYRLLGAEGMSSDQEPVVDQPMIGRLGYHLRPGPHAITEYDWRQYLQWADRYLPQP